MKEYFGVFLSQGSSEKFRKGYFPKKRYKEFTFEGETFFIHRPTLYDQTTGSYKILNSKWDVTHKGTGMGIGVHSWECNNRDQAEFFGRQNLERCKDHLAVSAKAGKEIEIVEEFQLS